MNAPNTLRELLPAGVQGQELIHESAHLHVTGEAVYTDDIPELRGTFMRPWSSHPWPMAS